MGKKKGGKKKGSKKKGKKGSSKGSKSKLSPEQEKAIAAAEAKAIKERHTLVLEIGWVDTIRTWFENNIASMFDALRRADVARIGILSCENVASALQKQGIPLKEDDVLTLVDAMDMEGDDKIRYCDPPEQLRYYGGGLQELVNRSVDRIKANHREDLAEIHLEKENTINTIKGIVKVDQGVDGAAAGADGDADEDNADDGDDGNDADGGGDDDTEEGEGAGAESAHDEDGGDDADDNEGDGNDDDEGGDDDGGGPDENDDDNDDDDDGDD
eukprot:m.886820 g.886820  ORF g.886820 m.886820 type:complete len:271 (+) comp23630_c0_seq2:142-954(+)